jgi:hypothetical protein
MYFNRKKIPRFIAIKVTNQVDSANLPQKGDNTVTCRRISRQRVTKQSVTRLCNNKANP